MQGETGRWVHLKSANNMAMSGLAHEKPLVELDRPFLLI